MPRTTRMAVSAAAFAGLLALSPALAQRQQPSPEQRIDRLEKQIQQVQRTVFPKGRPADTAGFSDEPAATQSAVTTLSQRIDSLERQMSDLVRQVEESGNRMRQLENAIGDLRAEQSRRIDAIERAQAEAPAAQPVVAPTEKPFETMPAKPDRPAKSKPPANGAKKTAETEVTTGAAAADDPAEAAYTVGFRLWEAGRFDAAIASLREFVQAYPNHRRTSFANNLIGRALLDKGDARAAVQAFVANYNQNPAGERAADSLYYMGQALSALGQPAQACNAYAELDKVFGDSVRADLRKLATEAENKIGCK